MKVILKNVRLSFPALYTPKAFVGSDGKATEPRFDASFIIEPGSENDKNIRGAIETVAKEKLGPKWAGLLKGMAGNSNKYCYRDGDTCNYDGVSGMMVLSTHSKIRPVVVDRKRNPVTESDGIVYAGCYVNATVDIWAQSGQNAGIRGSFNAIQFVKDGEAFGGGKPGDVNDFEDMGEGSDAPDFDDDEDLC